MDPIAQREGSECSLDERRIRKTLERLHRCARGDLIRFPRVGISEGLDRLLGRSPTVAERARRMKDVYVAITPDQGLFAYLVARSIGARRIVEFGTSFGVSTIYLAAAIRDTGGELVIGSEIEETKAAKALEHLEEAGLSEYVDIRIGDAQQTLANPGGAVDMVLMDGWKNLYLPIIRILAPHLRPGAVVLSDNINTFKRTLAPYVAYMRDLTNGFQSVTLPLGEGLLYSVRFPV